MMRIIFREARAMRFLFILSTALFPIVYATFGLTAREFFGRGALEAPSGFLSAWLVVLAIIFAERIFAREWSDRRRRQLALLPVSPHRIVASKFLVLAAVVGGSIAATALLRLGIHTIAPSRFLPCAWPETARLLGPIVFAVSITAFTGTAFAGRVGAMGGAAVVMIAMAGIGLLLYREWLSFEGITPERVWAIVPGVLAYGSVGFSAATWIITACADLHRVAARRLAPVMAAALLIGSVPGAVGAGVAYRNWRHWDPSAASSRHLVRDVIETSHGTYVHVASWNREHEDGDGRARWPILHETIIRLDDGSSTEFDRGELPQFVGSDAPWVRVREARCRVTEEPNFKDRAQPFVRLDGKGGPPPAGRMVDGQLTSWTLPFATDGRRSAISVTDKNGIRRLVVVDKDGTEIGSWPAAFGGSMSSDGRSAVLPEIVIEKDSRRVLVHVVDVFSARDKTIALPIASRALHGSPAVFLACPTAAGRYVFYVAEGTMDLSRLDCKTGETQVVAKAHGEGESIGNIFPSPGGRRVVFTVGSPKEKSRSLLAEVGHDPIALPNHLQPRGLRRRPFSGDESMLVVDDADSIKVLDVATLEVVVELARGEDWKHFDIDWIASNKLVVGNGRSVDVIDPRTRGRERIYPK